MIRVLARVTLALIVCAAAAAAESPQLSVTPSTGPVDAPLHVAMRKLLPGTRVTVSASRPDARGRNWTAVGEYLADATGTIDVDVSPSLGGTYTGVSAHGLWCSVLPVPPEQLKEYLADLRKHPELGTSPTLDVSALYTVSVAASIDGKVAATAKVTRSYAHGIVPEDVTAAGGVRGRFFPAASGTTPGVPVVVLAGSGGGLPETQAALLASHGHPALAQGIFGYKDLPSTLREIPLESFRAGAQWLKQRTGAQRVAIMGTSRGSEGAGLAASYFPQEFSAAIVYVPSHLTNGAFGPGIKDVVAAWTYAGKPLAADHGETDSNNAGDAQHSEEPPGFIGTPYYLKTWSDPAVSKAVGIPYERMQGPVLAIGGGADEMWPSFIGAEGIRRRLAEYGKADQVEVHVYPGAGHMVSRVGTGGALSGFVFHPVAKDFEATGGLPNANCDGSFDAWEKVLAFLAKVSAR
jgi:pimeloyl-ACP methyl ester carboxylesterase